MAAIKGFNGITFQKGCLAKKVAGSGGKGSYLFCICGCRSAVRHVGDNLSGSNVHNLPDEFTKAHFYRRGIVCGRHRDNRAVGAALTDTCFERLQPGADWQAEPVERILIDVDMRMFL
jgi:hypothetical protein